MSKRLDNDNTVHYEPSHLDLRCLQKPIIIAYGSERINPLSAIPTAADDTFNFCILFGVNKT